MTFDPSTPQPSPTTNPAPPIYVYFLVRPLTPDESFELTVADWAEDKGHDRASAITFVNYLNNQRMLISAVQGLMAAIDALSPEVDQTRAVELVMNGAFTRRELREPTRITAFFARPDRAEILAAWRESRLPTIGQVIQAMEADRRRKAKEDTAPPPPAIVSNGRDSRDTLANVLKAALPSQLRSSATDFAEGLRAMAADTCAVWNANTIAAAIKRRRVGTGTKICHRTITAGLPHLAKLGFVIVDGDRVRICPSAFV